MPAKEDTERCVSCDMKWALKEKTSCWAAETWTCRRFASSLFMTVSLAGGIGTSPLSRCGEALVASGCQVKAGWTGWVAVCRCWAWGRASWDIRSTWSCNVLCAFDEGWWYRCRLAADTCPDPMAHAMTWTATLSCNVPDPWDPGFCVPEQRCCDTLSVCVVSHRHHLKPHLSKRGEDGHINTKLSVLEVTDGHVYDHRTTWLPPVWRELVSLFSWHTRRSISDLLMRSQTGQSGTLCRAVLDRLREADCTGIDHCCRVPPSAAFLYPGELDGLSVWWRQSGIEAGCRECGRQRWFCPNSWYRCWILVKKKAPFVFSGGYPQTAGGEHPRCVRGVFPPFSKGKQMEFLQYYSYERKRKKSNWCPTCSIFTNQKTQENQRNFHTFKSCETLSNPMSENTSLDKTSDVRLSRFFLLFSFLLQLDRLQLTAVCCNRRGVWRQHLKRPVFAVWISTRNSRTGQKFIKLVQRQIELTTRNTEWKSQQCVKWPKTLGEPASVVDANASVIMHWRSFVFVVSLFVG